MREKICREYEGLAREAVEKFASVSSAYPAQVKCEEGCSDCCYSVFGLFLVESWYLKSRFEELPRKTRREVLSRCRKYDRELLKIEEKLQVYSDDPQGKAAAMARERIRCPLLGSGGRCVLYSYRPITCRVYGIPTLIGGKMHFCWKSGFETGNSYPAYDMDALYKKLYVLSRDLLVTYGYRDTAERASLLVSVSRAISAPESELLEL